VGKDIHGAGMPVGLARWMLTVHSRPEAVVHEPFAGTGTTFIAAEQLGRRCYGIEVNSQYVDVAVCRWQEFTGREATCNGQSFATVAADRAGGVARGLQK